MSCMEQGSKYPSACGDCPPIRLVRRFCRDPATCYHPCGGRHVRGSTGGGTQEPAVRSQDAGRLAPYFEQRLSFATARTHDACGTIGPKSMGTDARIDSLISFVPRFVAERISQGHAPAEPLLERYDAAVLFAD